MQPKSPNQNISKTDSNFLPQPPIPISVAPPRADFDKARYDEILLEKGVDVEVEKALQCPCRTSKIGPLSTCRNCGGTGWLFVNKRKTRLVLQGMNLQKTDENWSLVINSIINVSFAPEENLAYYDRITRLNAESIYSEVITLENYLDETFGFFTYQPKKIEYVGLYVNDQSKFIQLTENNFDILNQKITLKNIDLPINDFNEIPLTLTVRYNHAPTFHILEVNREPLDNFAWTGKGEKIQYLPGKALAKRTSDIKELVKLRQGKLNDNSYRELNCSCKL